MLKISAKTQYGLRALLYLARERERDRCTLHDIARGTHLTVPFLEQILVVLRRAGVVKVFRGAQGGYALAKSPEEITVLAVAEALEGKVKLLEKKEKNEALARFWGGVEQDLAQTMQVSLQELLLRDDALHRAISYSI